jgi:putative hemolysin
MVLVIILKIKNISIRNDTIFCKYFMKKLLVLALFLSLFTLSACGTKTVSKDVATTTEEVTSNTTIEQNGATSTEAMSLSNPAAINCVTKKGTLKTITRKDGNQYNICYLMDNRQCEEWALFRGDCPINGRKINGYDKEEQVYCVITGGQVDISKNTCKFQGQTCDLVKYYDGTCNE